jgi:DNA-binding NarL/FixJ family response regulator
MDSERAAQPACTVILLGHNFLFDTLLKNYLESHSDMKVFIVHGGPAGISSLPLPNVAGQNIIKLLNACGRTWTELSVLLDTQCEHCKWSSKIALFNVDPDSDIQSRALQWGVKGLIYASSSPEMIVKAIECVARGEIWAPRKELEKCIHEASNLSSHQDLRSVARGIVSEREVSVLALIAAGHSNRSIAEKLYLSEHTVKKHIGNIFRKLGVSNRFQAALWVSKKLGDNP